MCACNLMQVCIYDIVKATQTTLYKMKFKPVCKIVIVCRGWLSCVVSHGSAVQLETQTQHSAALAAGLTAHL